MNLRESARWREATPPLEEAYRAASGYPGLAWEERELLDTYREARKALADSPDRAGILAQFGWNLLTDKRWTEAEPPLRECLAIREMPQPDAWTTLNTKSLLGDALLGQNKFAEAELSLMAGDEAIKKREETIPPIFDSRISNAFDRLIELATATNRRDDVKKWQAERAKYPAATSASAEKK